MRLNKLLILFILTIGLSSPSLQAQNTNTAATVNSKGIKQNNTEGYIYSTDEAKKQLMSLFNLFRDYSVTLDTLKSRKTADSELSFNNVETSPKNFRMFLSKMDVNLRRKLEATSETGSEFAQREKVNKALVMLKSAECFADKTNGVFELSKDQNGNEIIAFPLDSLRRKSRYGLVDNFNEGFARIQKDQVFGFINLCGEEVITCQYEKAEPFNNGLALAYRMGWFFVDIKGIESAVFENVVDAKSLGYGISLLKFTNNAYTLVNNDYVSTKMPMSSYYESIEPFIKRIDVFRVRNGKKYGIIGLNGKIKLDPTYDDISAINREGVYRINLGGRIGLVDSNWKIQFTPSFTRVSDFNEYGIAEAKNENGTILIKKEGFVKSNLYENITAFNDFGIAVIRDANKNCGLIDTNFRVIIEPKYVSIGTFNEMGLAPACLLSNKCGFIKYDGTEQIKANYESVGNFNTFGLAVAKVSVTDSKSKKNEKITTQIVIDMQGNTVIPVTDEAIEKKLTYELNDTLFSDEFLAVYAFADNNRSNLQYHLIRKTNNQLITSTPYQNISPLDNFGNFRVKKNNLWGLMDSSGKVLSKPQFTQIRRVSENSYAVENIENKWGFINTTGKQQIPFEYDEVRTFRNGLVPASKNKNKWGLINRFNGKVVPCLFKLINEKGIKYEITDFDGLIYVLNDQGDCETNCPKFENIRAEANKASTNSATKK